MLEAYARVGNSQAAETIFTALLTKGLVPTDCSFVGLITAYALQQDFTQVDNVVQRIRSADFNVSLQVHNAVIAAYASANKQLRLYST